MGNNMCATEKKQEEQFEEKAEDGVDTMQEIAEVIKAKGEAAVEQVKEIAEDVRETVEGAVEEPKETAADATEAVADAVADVQEKAGEVAETLQEHAAEAVAAVKEAAADVADAIADTMTAAVAAVTSTMIIEFVAGKGVTKTVDFKSKALGFMFTRSSSTCCASAPLGPVVVSKVDKNQQADKLGVKRGWAIKAVNGTDVNGLEEATKLLEEGKAKLVDA